MIEAGYLSPIAGYRVRTGGDISGGAMAEVAKMIPNCTQKNYPAGVQPGDVGPAAAMFVEWLDAA